MAGLPRKFQQHAGLSRPHKRHEAVRNLREALRSDAFWAIPALALAGGPFLRCGSSFRLKLMMVSELAGVRNDTFDMRALRMDISMPSDGRQDQSGDHRKTDEYAADPSHRPENGSGRTLRQGASSKLVLRREITFSCSCQSRGDEATPGSGLARIAWQNRQSGGADLHRSAARPAPGFGKVSARALAMSQSRETRLHLAVPRALAERPAPQSSSVDATSRDWARRKLEDEIEHLQRKAGNKALSATEAILDCRLILAFVFGAAVKH